MDAEVRDGLQIGFGDIDGNASLSVEFAAMGERIEWDGSEDEAEEIIDLAVERFAEELEDDRPVDEGEGWRAYRS